jgi:parallel beta-helix repeat protein
LAVLSVAVLLGVVAERAAAIEPTHVECGQVLTASTIVANDLADCPEHGLVVGAHGIEIGLTGRSIDGVGLGAGVFNDGFDGVTIVGGTVRDFDHGVVVASGAADTEVAGGRFELNQEAGVLLSGAAPGTDVHHSTFAGNGLAIAIIEGTEGAAVRDNAIGEGSDSGLVIIDSTGNRIERNFFSASSDGGIVLERSSYNVVLGNDVSGVADAAVLLTTESNGNRLEANLLATSDGGIIVDRSLGNVIVDNVIVGMSDVGIDLDQAHHNVLLDNDLRSNGEGIALFDSSDNRVEGNDASRSSGTAIALEGASLRNAIVRNVADDTGATGIAVISIAGPGTGNLLDGNRASRNPGMGVLLSAPEHVIRNNIANDNGAWGIFAAVGNVDGGGNLASGNAEPAQCAGVQCDGTVAPPVDTVPPDTTITDHPRHPTAVTTATFDFVADEQVALFDCSLDSGPFVPCTSPHRYSGLGLGEHTFAVRATDVARNVETDPAVYMWTVVDAPGVDCGTAVTVVADADAWTDQNTSTTNKGHDSSLRVRSKGPADNFRALVHFPLPVAPVGCVLDSASLRMYADSTALGRTLHAARLAAPWSEESVTWANQPAVTGAVASAATGEEYRSWPVRTMVQAMYDEDAAHGFLIRDAVEGEDAEHIFSTRESDTPPQLILRFVPFVEPPPPTTTTTSTTTTEPSTTTTQPSTTTTTEPPTTTTQPPTTTTTSTTTTTAPPTTTTSPPTTTTSTTTTTAPPTTTTSPPTTTTSPPTTTSTTTTDPPTTTTQPPPTTTTTTAPPTTTTTPPPPVTRLSIGNASVTEPDGGTVAMTFTIIASPAPTGPVSVVAKTVNGTATEPSDYLALPAAGTTVMFGAGQTSRPVAVRIVGDFKKEPNETFLVVLSHPSGATLADSSGAGTIVNDDTCTIVGTASNDVLNGTLGNDEICGLGGNDTINGGAGNDIVRGGAGNDVVNGQAGNDHLDGGAGTDRGTWTGAPATVAVNLATNRASGWGSDTLSGLEHAQGGTGNDTISGNTGANLLLGGTGNDRIVGGAGNDRLDGGVGNDSIDGQDGIDWVHGSDGADVVIGGPGNDNSLNGITAGVHGGRGIDIIDGGTGTDWCSPRQRGETRHRCERP